MSLVIFLIGLLLAIIHHPKILGTIMARLFNEGMVSPRAVRAEKAEIIKYAGPNFTILLIGIILMIVGIMLRE